MLLANYYAIMTAIMAGVNNSGDIPYAKVKSLGGTVYNSITYCVDYTVIGLLPNGIATGGDGANYSGANLRFGTGIAPESIQDYSITNIPKITTTVGGLTVNYDNENKTFTITRRFVLNNNTSNAITITEYGITNYVYPSTSRTEFLVFRDLLEEEFTIQPNETVNFDLTLTYDLPDSYVPYA